MNGSGRGSAGLATGMGLLPADLGFRRIHLPDDAHGILPGKVRRQAGRKHRQKKRGTVPFRLSLAVASSKRHAVGFGLFRPAGFFALPLVCGDGPFDTLRAQCFLFPTFVGGVPPSLFMGRHVFLPTGRGCLRHMHNQFMILTILEYSSKRSYHQTAIENLLMASFNIPKD